MNALVEEDGRTMFAYAKMLWEKNIVSWLKSSSSEQGGKFYVPSHVDWGNNKKKEAELTYWV
jgi:hypothetical protein